MDESSPTETPMVARADVKRGEVTELLRGGSSAPFARFASALPELLDQQLGDWVPSVFPTCRDGAIKEVVVVAGDVIHMARLIPEQPGFALIAVGPA